jgi:hypothetical protein
MQPRGVSELKDSEQNEFRSASAEDFAEAMKELHSQIKERLQSSSKNTSAEQINTGENFNLKLVI